MLKNKQIYIILAIILLFNLIFISPILKPGIPEGGDTATHYELMLSTQDVIKTFFQEGEIRSWDPNYHAGFPMFYFYPPLIYLLMALVGFILPTLLTFKLTIVLITLLIPISVYFAAKLFGLEDRTAIIAAILSTLPSSIMGFGFETSTILRFGLFSHYSSLLFLPLALAFTYKFITTKENKNYLPFALLFITLSFFTGILTGFMVSIISILMIITFSKKQFTKKQLIIKIKKYAILMILCFISILFLAIPYITNSDYYVGQPFDSTDRQEGYGLNTLTLFLKGDLLDYSDFFRIPILTILTTIGIILFFAIKEFRNNKLHRFFILSLSLSLFFIIGKRIFTFLDYFPIINTLQTFRFILVFQFFAILIAAIAITWIIDTISKKIKKDRFIVFIIIILILTTPLFIERALFYNEKIDNFIIDESSDYFATIEQIKNSENKGRIYINIEETGGSIALYHSIPFLTNKPILLGYGLGTHDSLTRYYTGFPLGPGSNFENLFNVEFNLDGNYNILNTTNKGYFDLVKARLILREDIINSRDINIAWLMTHLSEINEHFVISETYQEDNINYLDIINTSQAFVIQIEDDKGIVTHKINTKYAPFVDITSPAGEYEINSFLLFNSLQLEKAYCGEIIQEETSRGLYKATVNVEDQTCFIMLKTSAHPNWKAYVDNTEQDWVMLNPSFMGVKVTQGQHDIEFKYTDNKRPLLILLGILVIVLVFYFNKKY
jgi:hypothetical protein